MKVSMTKEARSQFVMFVFLSPSKRLVETWQKNQTFTSAFDYFSLQIAILLSYKVTVVLKVLPIVVLDQEQETQVLI